MAIFCLPENSRYLSCSYDNFFISKVKTNLFYFLCFNRKTFSFPVMLKFSSLIFSAENICFVLTQSRFCVECVTCFNHLKCYMATRLFNVKVCCDTIGNPILK